LHLQLYLSGQEYVSTCVLQLALTYTRFCTHKLMVFFLSARFISGHSIQPVVLGG
jgi:hypothetical protein